MASAQGAGNGLDTISFFSRSITNQQSEILNSYENPNSHSGGLSLSQYLIAGWTLYSVSISIDSITAAPERESLISGADDYIRIENASGDVTDALYQGFYNQPHKGRLENYTIIYRSPYYDFHNGDVYLGVREDYDNSSTDMTSWITPFIQTSDNTTTTHDTSGDNAILDANSIYYVVINGTHTTGVDLGSFWLFNMVQWQSSSLVTGYATGYRYRNDGNWYVYSGQFKQEANLNYTYTPWNSTLSQPLTYSDPQDAQINANSTAMQGTNWDFSSATNITSISFTSGQSVYMQFDLTLNYKKTMDSGSSWYAPEEVSIIEWNISSDLVFPSVSSILTRGQNITIPGDWAVSGLYNSSYPSINHDQYSRSGDVIICTNLNTESWVLSCNAPNYITNVSLYDSSDDSEVSYAVDVGTILDVNTTVQSPTLIPAGSGSVNLTVVHSGVTAYAPANVSVTSGLGHHSWNTGTDHDKNGIHTLAVFWTNGTEAGYHTHDVVIVYPTEMTSVSTIDTYTDSTFSFSVFYNDSYTPQPLDGALVTVSYSFDSASNTTMTDHANGTWSGNVDTTGKSPGTYDLIVYGNGFAFENVSHTIKVTLIHDTQSLTVSWSDESAITFVQSSELIVVYRRTNGDNVTDAQVNATIEGKTWTMLQQPDETYRMRFNGTDDPPGFGVHPITIEAWKAGYESQMDNSEVLTIDKESTSLEVSWSNTNNITYLDHTILSVKFLMSNATEIEGAYLNVTDGTTMWDLLWNSDNKAYEIQFNGTDVTTGLGTHNLEIKAEIYGYYSASDSTRNITVREELTKIVLYWSAPHFNNITYIQQTMLYANFTLLDNTPIEFGVANVTFGIKTWYLEWNDGLKRYQISFNGTDNPPEFGNHSLSVEAWKHGFQSMSDSTNLVIRKDPTTITTDWSHGSTISYVNSTTLIVHYKMSNDADIENAIVNVTISGETWDMVWDEFDSTYKLTFNGTDRPFLGTHNLNISAWKYGFEVVIDTSQALVIEEELTYITYSWLSESNITYFEYTYFFVYYGMSNYSIIQGAILNVTIGLDHWDLLWNSTQQAYGIRFNGSDALPGLGTHTLNVSASAYGYASAANWSQSLNITVEGTDLMATWSAPNFDSITYLQTTELQVRYEMEKNGSAVLDAIVNVTIGTKTWNLTWQGSYYGIWFNGTDGEPGFGSHNLTIKAWKKHFQNHTNQDRTITIDLEPTSISSDVDDMYITYVENTYLVVSYTLLIDSSPVEDATVNVTIADDTWDLWWNEADGTYRIRFNGTDNLPGLGPHTLVISAWKYGHANETDSTSLNILQEPTNIVISWSPSDSITYLQNTVMYVNYRMSNFTSIPDANVVVFIGSNPVPWPVVWNASSGFHEIRFNGTDSSPGLGTFVVTVQASKTGFEGNSNSTQTLNINPEPTMMILAWGSPHENNITFVEFTTLYANYSFTNGTAIPDTVVNVTILGQPWTLFWHPELQLYRIQFNGTDNPPDIGRHNLTVSAWKHGYEEQVDSSQKLYIEEEPTNLIATWSDGSSITYLQRTVLLVNYTMSNGTSIPDATISVIIGLDSWLLVWNGSIHKMTFNGTDLPPGIGSHNLTITASKYGYENAFDDKQNLTITSEPTYFAVSWEGTHENNITYLESTTLYVGYYLSKNDTAIADATVNVTILTVPWPLTWNGMLELYEVTFDGADEPPGFGNHTLAIGIWRFGYTNHNPTTSLVIRPEPTTVTPNWIYDEFEYDKTLNLIFEYRDSHGTLVAAATQKEVWVNSTAETLLGNTGAYRILLDNRFDLGYHIVAVNISKYGYLPAYNDAVSFTILNASTYITVDWDSTSIDYLGQFDLTLFYGLQFPEIFPWVPTGGVTANLTIDGGTPMPLNLTGEYWTANITGVYLGLGAHTMHIEVWSYGYEFQEDISILIVNPVPTTIDYEWSPANFTIEYTMYLNLTLNYTYYGGEMPDTAEVNVTINARTFELTYISGSWRVSILGADVNTGVYDATIRASYPFFESQIATTIGINITPAANTFLVEWTPFDRNISYAESVSIAVVYTHDYEPVLGANVTLTINGTDLQNLAYSAVDKKWHISFDATVLGLGTWNFTIRANKTGYESKEAWYYVLVEEDVPNLTPSWTVVDIDYLTSIILNIDVDSSNGSAIVDAIIDVTLLSSTIPVSHIGSGIYNTSFGPYVDLGVHSINITFVRFGFQTTTIFLNLNVTAADATLTLDYTSLTIYYDEFVNLNASYLMANMSSIPGATFQLTANMSLHAFTWSGDHWSATFSGASLGLGSSICSVTVDAYGFRPRNASFTIVVQAIPTLMTTGPPGSTYVNGSYSFNVTFEDIRTSTYISPDDISIDWPGTYSYIQLAPGQFEITLNADLHNGTHLFVLNLTKTGHLGASDSHSIDVLPIPMELTYESSIEEYTDEMLEVSIYLNDTVYIRPVHWATVILSFHGSDYTMDFNSTTGSYHCQIHLNTAIPTGDYSLGIMATAIDCESSEGIISLAILPKDQYILTLSVSPEEVGEGEVISLTATLINDLSPVSGAEILFAITVFNQDGSQEIILSETTNGDGIAEEQFQVPVGATSIQIVAEFEGSRAAWAAASGASTVAVRQPGPSGLLALLSDPIVQLMIVAAVVGIAGVGYSRSRKKPRSPIDSISILNAIGQLSGIRHCILYVVDKRSHILGKSYLATGQDSYILRALEEIAAEGLRGNDSPGFSFEMSLHGLKLFIYRGKSVAGVLTAYETEKVRYKENLQLLVDTFEEQFGMELPDWPKNITIYGDSWRIIGPDASDSERIKAFVYSLEEGAIRAEIANRLNLSVNKVTALVKQILDSDPDFEDIRVGRKKLVVFHSALSDEIS